MEVVSVMRTSPGGGAVDLPFQRRNVEEWSRLDSLTGMLEHARVETDQWAASSARGSRQYGKVVDSRARNLVGGSVQQRQKREVEVFQAQLPGGSVQVVRTQSVSSSAWRGSTPQQGFDNLQLSLNQLDLGAQKTKASVGRSGSIGGRRPPSRPRSVVSKTGSAISEEDAIGERLSQVSRICQHIHGESKGKSLGRTLPQDQQDSDEGGVQIEEISDDEPQQTHKSVSRKKSSSTEDLHNVEDGEKGSDWRRSSNVRRSLQFPPKTAQERNAPIKLRQDIEDRKALDATALKGYEALKSVLHRGATIADVVNKSMFDSSPSLISDSLANHLKKENMNTQHTNRVSQNKRHSFVTVESLKEVRGRLRPLNSPPLEDTSNQKDAPRDAEDHDDGIVTEDMKQVAAPTSRVRSYVYGMEEISNRVAGRKAIPGTGSLESRTSSKSSGSGGSRSEEWYNRRKSYGFEPVHSHESDNQSQSIKFRDKNKVESSTDSGICRSSEAVTAGPWVRTSLNKNEVEDLTRKQLREHPHYNDSYLKMSHNIQISKQVRNTSSDTNEGGDNVIQKGRKTVVTLGNEFDHSSYKSRDENSILVRNSTIKDPSSVTLNGFRGVSDSKSAVACSGTRETHRPSEPVTITIPITSENIPDDQIENSNVENKRLFYRQLSEGTERVLLNGLHHSGNISSVVDRESLPKSSSQSAFKRGTWNGGDWMNPSRVFDNEMKRHSIAVDESKYVQERLRMYSNMNSESNKSLHFEKEFANVSTSELAKRFSALHSPKKEDSSLINSRSTPSGINVSFVQNGKGIPTEENGEEHLQNNKKQKKVEFCKTEVHFAAESGRFNIVQTDGKPPPANMTRRRRRSGGVAVPDKGNLPQVRFGDSLYEKKLLGGNEVDGAMPLENATLAPSAPHPVAVSMSKLQDDADTEDQVYTQANATIVASSSHEVTGKRVYDEDPKECVALSSDSMPRSILKNHRKPSPFILGENELVSDQVEKSNEEQEDKWGVHLRPVSSKEPAMWKSTVTLHNTAFECSQEPIAKENVESDHLSRVAGGETELQKLLRSLRPSTTRRTETVGLVKERSTDNGVQVKISSAPSETRRSSWSVADRIRQVEDLKQLETKGYSTRVNFGAGEATVVESDDQQRAAVSLLQQSEERKPIWARREERKQDFSVHDKKQTASNKGLVVRIGKSEDPSSRTDSTDALRRSTKSDCKKTTTTITIDLTPPLCDGDKRTPLGMKNTSGEILKSPSLIMKTINKPSLQPIPRKSVGGINSIQNSSKSSCTEKALESKITAEKPQNVQSLKDLFKRERDRNEKETRKRSETGAGSMPSQLAALKEMLYSGDVSDDSERADEEVRSYMSGGGEDDDTDVNDQDASSVVSGSWSRMRAFRNIRHHFHKFGGGGESIKTRGLVTDQKKWQEKYRKGYCDSVSTEVPQRSVATAVLPSYDPSRLRTVETLVSTRSGHPKITSISLRYEGDQDTNDVQERETRHHSKTSTSDRTFTRPTRATCLLQDTVRATSNPKATSGTHNYPRSKDISLIESTYQNDNKLFHLPKDGIHHELSNRDKEHSYITETSQCTPEKERLHVVENSPTRDMKYKLERRSKSPQDNVLTRNTSPPSDNKMVDYSPSKKSSATTPIQYLDVVKDRSPSPSARVKSRHKVAPTYFGLLPDSTCPASISHDINNSNRSDNQTKVDNKREISESKHWKYETERKDDWLAHQRSSSNTRRELKGSDCEEIVVRATQRAKADTESKERGKRDYNEKDARSRSASRGRSQSPSSESPSTKNRSDVRSSRESPIYQNRDAFPRDDVQQSRSDDVETESTILEELTRAADQILQAVNGYTDEDSNRPSSEEEESGGRRRRGRRMVAVRRSANLGTISETPSSRRPKDVGKSGQAIPDTQRSNVRRTQRLSSKTRLGQTSSTSSVESFTREIRRSSTAQTRALLKKERTSSLEDRAKRKATNNSTNAATKPGSRTARLLQRASSREMLLQTHASSSEDVMSGVEGENNRKPRAPRRSRTTNLNKTASLTSVASSTKKTSSPSPSIQHTSSPTATGLRKKESADTSKAKERHASCAQQKSVGNERSKSSRTKDIQRPTEEEGHRRRTKRGSTDLKQRTGSEKLSGGSFHPVAPVREKSDRSSCERRLAGHTSGSRSATPHVVTKKKPSSSRSEGVSRTKSTK